MDEAKIRQLLTDANTVVEQYTRRMQYKVRPKDIVLGKTGATCNKSFGMYEAEKSAGNLVKFFQAKGYWAEFTVEEFTAFCKAQGLWNDSWGDDQLLYGLAKAVFDKGSSAWHWESSSVIVVRPDYKLAITKEFIERCMGCYKPKRND